MKYLTELFAIFLCATCSSADFPYGTITLDGGRVEPISMKMIKASNENLNFCFATAFPDGSIYLNHSKGIHTVTESACRDHSVDGGRTWRKTVFDFGGFNAFQGRNGKKHTVSCWDDNISDHHEITLRTLSDDGKSVTTEKSLIELQFRSTFRLHREVIRTGDGSLLLPGYGRKEGVAKLSSFLIASKDDGKSWQYLSTIMEDPQSKTPEGPNEASVVELKNGELLAFLRIGGTSPLQQLRSKDGGKTWSAPEEIAPFCVAPSAKRLADGTLAIITGRPKLYLLLDFTGTGRNYQRVCLYNGSGSSYASIIETEPGRLLVIYDESDFGSWRNTGLFSRIMAMTVAVVRDDMLKRPAVNDPEASKYQIYYSAATELPPQAPNFIPHNYQKKDQAGSESWYEIRKIAERPHPVLHLEHRGVTGTQRFSHFVCSSALSDVKKITAGFEFRLGDAAETRPQFAVRFGFEGAENNPNLFGWIAFGIKEISYRTAAGTYDAKANYKVNGKIVKFPYDLESGFHSFVVEADASSGTFRLYKKDEKNPLFTGTLTPTREIPPGITIGDGAADVFGAVDLSYFGWFCQ